MGDILLDSNDYKLVRSALDTSLDDKSLPDSVIAQTIYLGAAEREVKGRDTDWATRADDELERLKSATAYLTAARLAPAVVRETSIIFQARDMNFNKPAWDVEEKVDFLRKQAEVELSDLLEPEERAPNRPTMFTVASGRRGR